MVSTENLAGEEQSGRAKVEPSMAGNSVPIEMQLNSFCFVNTKRAAARSRKSWNQVGVSVELEDDSEDGISLD